MNSSIARSDKDTDFSGIACTFCEGLDTRVVSMFGGNAGESLMYCQPCRSYFHWIKWRGALPPHPRGDRANS